MGYGMLMPYVIELVFAKLLTTHMTDQSSIVIFEKTKISKNCDNFLPSHKMECEYEYIFTSGITASAPSYLKIFMECSDCSLQI